MLDHATAGARLLATALCGLVALLAGAAPSAASPGDGAPPMGVPFKTDFDASRPGIRIGSDFYPMGDGKIQMVVLDRATLNPGVVTLPGNVNRTFRADSDGIAALDRALDGAGGQEGLVILSTGGRTVGSLGGSELTTLANDFVALGGILGHPGPGSRDQLQAEPWSLVGIPSLSAGQAHQLIGLRMRKGAAPGAMDGFLQVDLSGNWTFVWPSTYHTFDTQAPGAISHSNRIAVDGQDFQSQQDSTAVGYFQLLWLDAGTLEVKKSATYDAFACEPPRRCLEQLAADLRTIQGAATPGLIVLTTGDSEINPTAAQFQFGRVALPLLSFGANQYAFLSSTQQPIGYTLVGTAGLNQLEGPNAGDEIATSFDTSPRLAGVLRRNRQGMWVAGASGRPQAGENARDVQPGLQRVLAQAPQPFGAFDTPAEEAAEQAIAQHLGLPLDPRYGIRANYWENASADWDALALRLDAMAACTTSPCRAPIREGRFRLDRPLDERTARSITTRGSVVQTTVLYRGDRRMRGEMATYQVLAAP